ncbi:polysaccharide export protein EpsE [Ideonella sp. 4Y11]|uniref:Polysaccharide export protein EpsE n=1 Tax=Ideonella aquatica TaxID=2824119 RepID=A0A940YL83_9BURK|nr:polysaccharide export protein EpsE [Ideonella aquatica]MBQ0959914.1 polysaccharide export protein EpsE [Ideonella aquatica]
MFRSLIALLSALLLSALPAVAQPTITIPASDLAASTAPEYRLGPGDSIRVQVYQSPDLSLELRLSDAGMVSYPLLGAIRLGSLTVSEAEQFIAEGLKRGEYIKNPQVTVLLMQARGSQVSVLGQVAKPGRYPLEQGGTRLSELLAQAGGVLPTSGADRIVVVGTRAGKPFRAEVDLPSVFDTAERPGDLVLHGYDTLWVERAPLFYIYGEVQRPGQLRLERGMTLLQGLAAGGGLTLRGTEKGIRIHRRGPDGAIQILQPDMAAALRDGDVIYVRESLF